MLEVRDLVKTIGYFEMSKVNDIETTLIRDIIRSFGFPCNIKKGKLFQDDCIQPPITNNWPEAIKRSSFQEIQENSKEVERISTVVFQG